MASTSRAAGTAVADALAWFLLPAIVLSLVPIGYVTAEGVGRSGEFARGLQGLNSNHLLFEPLGAAWQGLLMRAGWPHHPVDALRLLSVASGGLAAALFRLGVAPRVAAGRWQANHATAWMVLSSSFLQLWIADETHMIQLPLLVGVLWLALRRAESPAIGRSVALGAGVGLAGLAFVSNLLLGVTLGAAYAAGHLRRREGRLAARTLSGVAAGMVLAAGLPLLAAWWAKPIPTGPLAWVFRYQGGQSSLRVESAYGLEPSLAGLAVSSLRAAYGAASSLVDLADLGAVVRDRQPSLAALAPTLAFLAAGFALAVAVGGAARRSDGRARLSVALAWGAAVLAFGVFWNNSEDQFFVQLAPLYGLLAATLPDALGGARRRLAASALVAGVFALSWNVFDVTAHRILYPREDRLELLSPVVRDACLAIAPGYDEVATLLEMLPPAQRPPRLSLASLAVEAPPEAGLPELRRRVETCRAAGGRVVLLDVYDTAPLQSPWQFLRTLGYERRAVEVALAAPGPSRRVGPFTVRELPPRPGGAQPPRVSLPAPTSAH